MEIHVRGERSYKKPLIAAAVAVVAAAGAIEFARRPAPAPSTEHAWPGQRLAMPAPAPVAPPAPAASSSFAADLSTFDKLVDLFKGVKDEPAAQRFAGEFMEKPELKKTIDDLKEDSKRPDPKETLDTVADSLAQKVEFRQLVAKFAQDSGFREVMAKLTASPEVRGILNGMIARLQAPLGAPRTTTAVLGRGVAGGARGTLARAGGPSLHAAANAFAGGAELGAGARGGASPTAGGKVQLGGGDNDRTTETPGNGAQTDAHDVKSILPKSPDAGPADKRDLWFLQQFPFLGTLSAEDRLWLESEGGAAKFGLWGACFKRGIFKDCMYACDHASEAPLRDDGSKVTCGWAGQSGWDLCVEDFTKVDGDGASAKAECLAMCSKQPPCEVPKEERCSLCGPDVNDRPSVCSSIKTSDCSSGGGACNGTVIRGRCCSDDEINVVLGCKLLPGQKPPQMKPALLGFDIKKGKYVVNPDERKVVNALVALYVGDTKYNDLGKLRAALRQAVGPKGKTWNIDNFDLAGLLKRAVDCDGNDCRRGPYCKPPAGYPSQPLVDGRTCAALEKRFTREGRDFKGCGKKDCNK